MCSPLICIGNVLTWAPEGFQDLVAMPHSFVTSSRHFPVDLWKFSAVEGWVGGISHRLRACLSRQRQSKYIWFLLGIPPEPKDP